MVKTKIVHFINNFFAGIGGEDKSDTPVGVRPGPVGPGNGLKRLLPPTVEIAGTVYAGDNYFNENLELAGQQVLEAVRQMSPQLLVAGPAFDSGRYGAACAEVCHHVSRELGIPSLSAMYEENPGVDIYRNYKNPMVFIFPSGRLASSMPEALATLSRFIAKITAHAEIASAAAEGYFPRGIRRLEWVDKTGVERAIDMLVARLNDQPYTTEVPLRSLARVNPALPLVDVSTATIALANTTGIAPFGNPDGFMRQRNIKWKKYFIGDLDSLQQGKWEAIHGGHDTKYTNSNPNWGAPLDVARKLEGAKFIGRLYPYLYTTPGNMAYVNVMEQFGREMAADMKAEGVQGVLLVST